MMVITYNDEQSSVVRVIYSILFTKKPIMIVRRYFIVWVYVDPSDCHIDHFEFVLNIFSNLPLNTFLLQQHAVNDQYIRLNLPLHPILLYISSPSKF